MDTRKVENYFLGSFKVNFKNSDISLLFRLLEQASITIEQQQHQMRVLKSEQDNFKQLISTLQEQVLVEIKKGAILSNQLIATREQLDGIRPTELPWNILSVAMKPFRTHSDIELLTTATENNELQGKNSKTLRCNPFYSFCRSDERNL